MISEVISDWRWLVLGLWCLCLFLTLAEKKVACYPGREIIKAYELRTETAVTLLNSRWQAKTKEKQILCQHIIQYNKT